MLTLASCRTGAPPPPASLEAPPGIEVALQDVGRLLRSAVAERAFPGGVLVVGSSRGSAEVLPFGRLTYDPESPAVTAATLYDLASLTKVVATTSAAMVLVDEGRLTLDAPVSSYLPAFAGGAKDAVTVRQLPSWNTSPGAVRSTVIWR